MNYSETINWLYSQLPFYQNDGHKAYKKDISNIIRFCNKFGHHYQDFNSIHVGGTNGKGSVSHMLSSILQTAGYQVGLFTSPHIYDFRERIKLNGANITSDFVVQFVQKYKIFFIKHKMSFFEMSVLMAFSYFSFNKVDVAIIEVGLGGRLDSTNIIDPKLSIITNVSLDHMNILGNSIELIAKEKAGIIKPGRPILIKSGTSYKHIFENEASRLGSPLYYFSDYNLSSDLKGQYQLDNINASVSAIKILNYDIKQIDIYSGLNNVVKNTGLLARWQIVSIDPLIICDIAHNMVAINSIMNQLSNFSQNKHIILGFANDKNINQIISILPQQHNYYICGSSNSRIINPELIKTNLNERGLVYKTFPSSSEALSFITSNHSKNVMIIITGSTFIVSDALKYLR